MILTPLASRSRHQGIAKTAFHRLTLLATAICVMGLTACESVPNTGLPAASPVVTSKTGSSPNPKRLIETKSHQPTIRSSPPTTTSLADKDDLPSISPNNANLTTKPTQDQPTATSSPALGSSNANSSVTAATLDHHAIDPKYDHSSSIDVDSKATSNPLTRPQPPLSQHRLSGRSTDQAPASSRPNFDITTSKKPDKSDQSALLKLARQHSGQKRNSTAPTTSTGDQLPAFRQLMYRGLTALKSNRLAIAEQNLTRAQRLAPKSSAVYFYLAQVAIKKNQPRKAEAMARRGLVVARSLKRRRALWQVILQSGQLRRNPKIIAEATQALR